MQLFVVVSLFISFTTSLATDFNYLRVERKFPAIILLLRAISILKICIFFSYRFYVLMIFHSCNSSYFFNKFLFISFHTY